MWCCYCVAICLYGVAICLYGVARVAPIDLCGVATVLQYVCMALLVLLL